MRDSQFDPLPQKSICSAWDDKLSLAIQTTYLTLQVHLLNYISFLYALLVSENQNSGKHLTIDTVKLTNLLLKSDNRNPFLFKKS